MKETMGLTDKEKKNLFNPKRISNKEELNEFLDREGETDDS
jgi:hypothetical protein